MSYTMLNWIILLFSDMKNNIMCFASGRLLIN